MIDGSTLAIAPDATAYAYRAVLTTHRMAVGAFGFVAIGTLLRGPRWRRLGALFAGLALLYAGVMAALYAGPSIIAVALTIVVASALATLIAAWPARHDGWTRLTLASVAVAGCLAITNFLQFHDWRWMGADAASTGRFGAINYNDMFHHYLAAKYFSELSYDGLYACAALAEVEQGESRLDLPARDLRSNRLVTIADILPQSAPCRARFTAERWRAFAADVALFRQSVDDGARMRFLTDFGYNSTPLLTALHRFLIAGSTPTTAVLGALASIDTVLFVVSIGFLAWAFGPMAAALGALAWGVGTLWVYNHVGLPGSPGRLWWVAAMIAAICFARRSWFFAVGLGLAAAAMFRAFPAVFLLWPVAVAIHSRLRGRPMPAEVTRLLIGAAIGAVVLGAISVIGLDPWQTYAAFLRNALKHAASGFSNGVGLTPLIGVGPGSAIWWMVAAGLTFATAIICRRLEWSAALCIAGIAAMFVLFSLTNYDYVILVLLAPFAVALRDEGRGLDLFAFAVCVLLGNLAFIATPGADRLIYTTGSATVVLTLCYFLARWARAEALSPSPAGRADAVPASLRNGPI